VLREGEKEGGREGEGREEGRKEGRKLVEADLNTLAYNQKHTTSARCRWCVRVAPSYLGGSDQEDGDWKPVPGK
jgi:hypothetical protein